MTEPRPVQNVFRTKPTPAPSGWSRAVSFIFLTVSMMGAWVLLSGRFDAFHLALGLLCSLLVAKLSLAGFTQSFRLERMGMTLLRHVTYVPWLMGQIFLANLRVLRLVLHPRMRELIDPHLVRYDSRLIHPNSLTSFAQSITLTPGTITVRVRPDGEFIIHAIDRPSGDVAGLKAMEKRVARTFGES